MLRPSAIAATSLVLADRVRQQNSSHEGYLVEVPSRWVADRGADGRAVRTGWAPFPADKTLEDHSRDRQPGLRREMLIHLASGAPVGQVDELVLLGTPGVGGSHLWIVLGCKAVHLVGYPGWSDTAGWLARRGAAWPRTSSGRPRTGW